MNAKQPSKCTLSIISIFWPSFLTAVAGTIIFFAFFDPLDFGKCVDASDNCRLNAYSIGFLSFWALTICTAALTCYFRRPCEVK